MLPKEKYCAPKVSPIRRLMSREIYWLDSFEAQVSNMSFLNVGLNSFRKESLTFYF